MSKRLFLIIFSGLLIMPCFAEDHIVYIAHQDWPSRIYILRMNGTVYDYFEYDITRFCDVEVVNNEVYVAEAFAPRAYKVDLNNGDLEVIIDDWSLYYFYDLGFDGTYFYVDEWDLNRYFLDGTKDGVASFNETVFGSAWDGSYLWTMDDNDHVKCWDISGWPSITQIPGNNFSAPDTNCRGLWFDGQYFWTAQSLDGVLGYIYRFDHDGIVIDQWLEPAYRGWAACLVDFTGVEETKSMPDVTSPGLVSVSPNPFKQRLTLHYYINKPDHIEISIHNVVGQRITTLKHGFVQAGQKTSYWSGLDDNGEKVVPGIYIIRFKSGKITQTQKILFIR